jgi:hypothetical protein
MNRRKFLSFIGIGATTVAVGTQTASIFTRTAYTVNWPHALKQMKRAQQKVNPEGVHWIRERILNGDGVCILADVPMSLGETNA